MHRAQPVRTLVAAAGLAVAMTASPFAQNPSPAQEQPPPQEQTPATPAGPPAPPDSLGIGRDRVVAPRPITRVTPQYTPEAMRARIQGVVTLRGVVELDGTISGIQVVTSLDPTGLDQAAVDAFRQWRFEPGTIDGQPVRIAITVNLNFALTDTTPVQRWPEGFTGPTSPLAGAAEVVDDRGLRLTITRPENWTVHSGTPREWLVLRSADGSRVISVLRPEGAAFELRWSVPEPMVARIAESLRRGQTDTDAQTVESGQIQASRTFWVWSAMKISKLPAPVGGAPASAPTGEARVWVFTHTPEGRVVAVSCGLVMPAGLDSAEIDARVKAAAAEFGPIVDSIAIGVVPG